MRTIPAALDDRQKRPFIQFRTLPSTPRLIRFSRRIVVGCKSGVVHPVRDFRHFRSHGSSAMKRAASASFVVALVVCAFVLTAFAPRPSTIMAAQPAVLARCIFRHPATQAVAQDFDRGVALLHSFWFSAAIEAFNGVLKNDPSCAMAHWGIAMSWWGNPFGGFRSPQALQAGLAAIEKGKAAGAKTERERGYIAAVEVALQGRSHDPAADAHARVREADGSALDEVSPTTPKRGSSTRWRWIKPRCRPTRRTPTS